MIITNADAKRLIEAFDELQEILKGNPDKKRKGNPDIPGDPDVPTPIKCYEELFKRYINPQREAKFDVSEALEVLQIALRIEQIYFRVVPILNYMEAYPDDFVNTRNDWVEEGKRVQELYKEIKTQYLDILLPEANEILRAYKTLHEPSRHYAADAPPDTPRKKRPKATNSVISHDAVLDHINFKLKTNVEILAQAIKDHNYLLEQMAAADSENNPPLPRPSKQAIALSRLKLAQLQVDSFRLKGKAMDRTLANALDVYAQQAYRSLQSKHEPINTWLNVLIEATKKAQANLRVDFAAIKAKLDQIDNAERTLVKVVLGAFYYPASNLVDPVFNIIRNVSAVLSGSPDDKSTLAERIGTSKDQPAIVQLGAFVNCVINGDPKMNPVEAITKHLESRPANSTLEIMQAYVNYKIESPKIYSDLFNKDTKLWGGIEPLKIIKAKRRELMEKYKREASDNEWKNYYCIDKYEELYKKVAEELWEHFTKIVDDIFDSFAAQYTSAKALEDVVSFIKQKTFNDAKAGVSSYEHGSFDEVISVIANEFELSGLVRFAVTHQRGWGGTDKPSQAHLKAIKAGTFQPQQDGVIAIARDWQTDYINNALYRRYVKTMPPHGNKSHNPFIDYDWFNDLWAGVLKSRVRYTAQQLARYRKICTIIYEYYNTPLDARLLRSIEMNQQQNTYKAPQMALLMGKLTGATVPHPLSSDDMTDGTVRPTAEGIDQMHEWQPEEVLHKRAADRLQGDIKAYRSNKLVTQAERTHFRSEIYSKINLIHWTQLNQHVEMAKKADLAKKAAHASLEAQAASDAEDAASLNNKQNTILNTNSAKL
jgi:hypothetical protein